MRLPDRFLPLRLSRVQVRLWWMAALILGLMLAAHAVQSAWDLGGEAGDEIFTGWYFNAMLISVTLAVGARALLVPQDRLAWALLAAGAAFGTVGQIYTWSVLNAQEAPPFPSIADALFLAFLPCAYIALVLFARARIAGMPVGSWIDGLIGALFTATLATAIVLPPVLDAAAHSTAAAVTCLAYPLGDTLLVAGAVWVLGL
ncbi:MAG TPA: hypothetical protein VJB36_07930, partial [Methylomirabilota bacterium]|nr:hypothetical protein [Methylomirabilota bacterium]